MKRVLILAGIVTCIAMAIAAPAWAAKGTVKSINTGTGGDIVVTDLQGLIGIETTPGEIIAFTESVSFPAGTAVTFDIVPGPPSLPHGELAINITLLTEGTVITENHSGPIDVGPNESVLIHNGARIEGKITVHDGSLLLLAGVVLEGKIEAGAGGCVYIEGTSRIHGKIESNSATCLTIRDNLKIDGKISSTNDGFVRISDNTIKGKLEVRNVTGGCSVAGNTVDGKVNVPPVCVMAQ